MTPEVLCAAIENGQYWLEQFRLKTYPEAFQAYKTQYGPVFRQALEEVGEAGTEQLARTLLDTMEAGWKRKFFWNRSAARQDCRRMIVTYLTPMLLELETPEAKTLCSFLRDGWAERWPKEVYRIGSYERINSGFRNAIMGIEIGRPKPNEGEDL